MKQTSIYIVSILVAFGIGILSTYLYLQKSVDAYLDKNCGVPKNYIWGADRVSFEDVKLSDRNGLMSIMGKARSNLKQDIEDLVVETMFFTADGKIINTCRGGINSVLKAGEMKEFHVLRHDFAYFEDDIEFTYEVRYSGYLLNPRRP